MGLVSFEMIAFIMLSFGLVLLCKNQLRKLCLLGLSMAFVLFCGNQWHLLWLSLVSLYACFAGRVIYRTHRLSILFGAMAPVIISLCFFKYSSFFGFKNLIMPLGISFYTFKIISLFCDLYQGKCEWAGWLDTLVYLMFFPTVSAGPIHRAQTFFVQLKNNPEFDYAKARNSVLLISLGMFQKLVFADTLAGISASIFSNDASKGPFLVLGAVIYSFQLYLDFDGYSNIAVGISRLLGFQLEKNFNSPYLSKTIMEFWNRWHISLSTWLKDYIYIPLGGNRKGEIRRVLNIFCVFLVSGVWHGSSWVFVIWGLGHGFLHMTESWLKQKTSLFEKTGFIYEGLFILINFSFVTVLWVFFSSTDLNNALNFLKRMVMIDRASLLPSSVGLSVPELIWVTTVIVVTCFTDVLRNKMDMIQWIADRPVYIRWSFYLILIFMTIVFGAYGPGHNASDFIYISF